METFFYVLLISLDLITLLFPQRLSTAPRENQVHDNITGWYKWTVAVWSDVMVLNHYLLPEERHCLQRKLFPVQRCLNLIQALKILQMGGFHSVCIYLLSCWHQLKRDHCCQLWSIKVDWRGKHHLRLWNPQACTAALQVKGTPGLSSLPVNTAEGELRASSKAHKAAVVLAAWQRDTEFI